MIAIPFAVVNTGQSITIILNFTFPPNPYILCLFSSSRQQFRLSFNFTLTVLLEQGRRKLKHRGKLLDNLLGKW